MIILTEKLNCSRLYHKMSVLHCSRSGLYNIKFPDSYNVSILYARGVAFQVAAYRHDGRNEVANMWMVTGVGSNSSNTLCVELRDAFIEVVRAGMVPEQEMVEIAAKIRSVFFK